MPDYAVEIAQLEQLLNSGAKSTAVDGMLTSFDLAEVRRRLAELRQLHDGDPDTPAAPARRQRLVPYRFS